MMERPLWQKITLGVVIALAAVWALYNFYLKNRIKEFFELKATLASLQMEIDIIRPRDIVISNAVSFKEELAKQSREISKRMPSEIDVPYVMERFIKDSSKGMDIEYLLVQPLSMVQEKKYKKMPVLVELIADFEDLNLYLNRIQNLQLIIRIDEMGITKVDKTQDLDVKLRLSAFFLPGPSSVTSEARLNLAQVPSIDPFFESRLKKMVSSFGRPYAGRKTRRASQLPRYKGIFKGATTKVFVNNEVVGIGEKVNGYMISEISDKRIVVTKAGKRYTLTLGR